MAIDFEKLGVFYLGRRVDPETRERTTEPFLVESRDLVTHAVCIGMTGSGKTGLCLSLLEEAAMDGVPAIAIDPKGDLGNLLLTFPDLSPGDFRPWINEDDARRQGVEPEEFAARQAQLWRKGLAEWGQDGDRIRRLRQACDVSLFTPGSSSGRPVSVLASFAAPPPAVLDDPDAYRARLSSASTSLLGLLGIDADPLRSREHILLSNILDNAWRGEEALDLPALVGRIQDPPLERVGVLDLEAFYPKKERFDFALRLNNLLASPSFGAWASGESLDVGALLHGPTGHPRISIFSIAHLGDAERMFFVSLLLSEIVSWMRTQPGTSSLRALVYMDEVFGFLPPVANPPSKESFLVLLKQARAFGVGMVLATQNPVDLDYKALSNAGTWFLGRLQTERDKDRVLAGLDSAAKEGFDREAASRLLGTLGKRVFVAQSAHRSEPDLFETRWAMSYLRGPLTLTQIQTLTRPAASEPGDGTVPSPRTPAFSAGIPDGAAAASNRRPVLPPDVEQVFLPARGDAETWRLVPMALGAASIRWADRKLGLDEIEQVLWLAPFVESSGGVAWEDPLPVAPLLGEHDLLAQPPELRGDVAWEPTGASATKAKSYVSWKRSFADRLASVGQERFHAPGGTMISRAGETERDFRLRAAVSARESRDEKLDAVRAKNATKLNALSERVRRAEAALEKERAQAGQQKMQAAISVGASVLGALFGRRKRMSVTRVSTAARGVGRAMEQSSDVGRAEENLEALRDQLREMEAEIEGQLSAITSETDPSRMTIETVEIRPKKTQVGVQRVVLAWTPYRRGASGAWEPAWR